MSIFSRLFKKKDEEEEVKESKMEGFMTIIRVYYQSVMAINLGITNIRMLPDMALFKRVFKVPTQGGKLGQAEKTVARKILMQDYGLSDNFFKEIDASIKRNCKNANDVMPYLSMFQGFTSDLLMLIGNLLKWKFGIPKVFKKALHSLTEKTIHDILTKDNWKSDDVRPVVKNIRKYKERLGYSEQWMVEYASNIVILAKSEKRRKAED